MIRFHHNLFLIYTVKHIMPNVSYHEILCSSSPPSLRNLYHIVSFLSVIRSSEPSSTQKTLRFCLSSVVLKTVSTQKTVKFCLFNVSNLFFSIKSVFTYSVLNSILFGAFAVFSYLLSIEILK